MNQHNTLPSICFVFFLTLSGTLLSQTRYWNSRFQQTRENTATYFSEEEKNDTAKIRTYFYVEDKIKYRQIALNKRGFIRHELLYYASGKVQSETFFSKRGTKVQEKDFFENGALMSHRVYNKRGFEIEGKKFYENGNLMMERAGRSVKWFNEDGSPRTTALGSVSGTFNYTYPSGQKKAKLIFDHGIMKQPELYWYENGQLRSVIPPKPYAERHYYPNGRLVFIQDSVMANGDHVSFRWDSLGNLRQKTVQAGGKEDKFHTYFYPGGEKSAEGRQEKWKRVGIWTFYRSNGEKWFEIDKDKEEKSRLEMLLKDMPVSSTEAINPEELLFMGIPQIQDFFFVEEEPRPRNMDDIKRLIGYPQLARDKGIEGSVIVRVLVDEDGKGVRYRLIRKVHPLLDYAVERQIYKLTYIPASKNGKTVPFWVNIPFNFKLLN